MAGNMERFYKHWWMPDNGSYYFHSYYSFLPLMTELVHKSLLQNASFARFFIKNIRKTKRLYTFKAPSVLFAKAIIIWWGKCYIFWIFWVNILSTFSQHLSWNIMLQAHPLKDILQGEAPVIVLQVPSSGSTMCPFTFLSKVFIQSFSTTFLSPLRPRSMVSLF